MRDGTGGRQIFTIPSSGAAPAVQRTTSGTSDQPFWSRDGLKIAFSSNRPGSKDRDIFVMNPDGTGQTNLTMLKGDDQRPAWRPDGQRIAFTSNRSGNFEIYWMTSGGATPTKITNDRKKDTDPTYSPDGFRIAFGSDRTTPDAGGQEIWSVNAQDGLGLARVTTLDMGDRTPYWFETNSIVFASQSLGGLAVVSPTGTAPTKIPNTTKDDKNPG